MKSIKQSLVLLAATAMLSIALTPVADAQVLPGGGSPVVNAVSGGFNWDYDALLTSGSQLETGDFFVIYDFGIGSLVTAPVGWVLSFSALSPTPVGGLTPTQNSALNFMFTYSGATVGGPANLGDFVLFSTLGTGGTSEWASDVHDANGSLEANLTSTLTPAGTINVTPEPATMTLMATGLVGIIGAGHRRRKRA